MAEIEDIKAIKNHLQNEELKNVYLFYGPEGYLKDLYESRIRTRLDVDSMNCYFFGQDADVREIESICATTSMFGDKKLVVVSGSGMFKAATETSFVEIAEIAIQLSFLRKLKLISAISFIRQYVRKELFSNVRNSLRQR